VHDLAEHFQIPFCVCINKYDLNPEITASIESAVSEWGSKVIGQVRYSRLVTEAQIHGVSVVEYSGGAAAQDIRKLWNNVAYELEIGPIVACVR
jgi:MinD superfamily P-loop ATPase